MELEFEPKFIRLQRLCWFLRLCEVSKHLCGGEQLLCYSISNFIDKRPIRKANISM